MDVPTLTNRHNFPIQCNILFLLHYIIYIVVVEDHTGVVKERGNGIIEFYSEIFITKTLVRTRSE